LISDTHGLLRPEAVRALTGVEQIIHAGDVGAREVLERLQSIAPVHAVRGNNDRDPWARTLPTRLSLRLAGIDIYVLHDVQDLRAEARVAGCRVVVTGHSHRPAAAEREGVLFVNPGSAGPRRLRLPVTVGYLTITGNSVETEIRNLL
jgi:putative phosphoesterase